jgi:hypothetical protein
MAFTTRMPAVNAPGPASYSVIGDEQPSYSHRTWNPSARARGAGSLAYSVPACHGGYGGYGG